MPGATGREHIEVLVVADPLCAVRTECFERRYGYFVPTVNGTTVPPELGNDPTGCGSELRGNEIGQVNGGLLKAR